MGEMKPWQIVVIAAAVLAVGYTGWNLLSGSSIKQPDGIMTVDIMTGQLYEVKKGKARGIMNPVKHPDTQERTLFKVEQDPDTGEWSISNRYVSEIDEDLRERSRLRGSGFELDILDTDPIITVLRP